MNIIHFTDTYLPLINGVSLAVEQFTEKAKDNNNVLLIAPSYSLRSTIEKKGKFTIRRIRSIPFPIYPGVHAALPNLVGMYRLIRDFKPDIIHTHTPFVLGTLGGIFSQIFGIKLVSTYHTLFSLGAVYLSPKRLLPENNLELSSTKDSEQGILAQVIWQLQKIFFNICDAVIAPTKVIADTLSTHGIKTKITVLPSGVELDKFEQKTDYTPKLRLIHLGRLGLEKSIDIVFRAFKIVHEEIPAAVLVVAGDGPAKGKLKKLATELGLGNSVEFTGMIDPKNTPQLYRSCDIFVTASAFETQGLVLIEAMLSGLPVVAAAVNAPIELVTDGKNGYLFEEGSFDLCAEKLIYLLKHPKKIEEMGRKARVFGETFDSEKVSNQLIAVYRKLLTNQPL